MNQPAMSVWYHKFGSDMGNLYIEIETGGVWTIVDSIIGETQISLTDPWKNKIVDLQAYINNAFSIRFRGIRGVSYYGDISIDDLEIFDLPNDEAELVDILSPGSKCLSDYNNDTISLTIKNNGANPISSIDVTYEFNGGAAINETVSFNPALIPTASTVVNLSNTINVTSAGSQDIKAYISLNGDIDNSNDTISYTFESYSEGGMSFSINTNYDIPDGDPTGGIMIPMIFCGLPQNIDSCFYIKRLSIDSLSHTYLGDLDIYLISPSMDTLEVSTDNGGSGSNMFNVHFVNDNGNDITLQTSSIVSDNYLPEEAIGFKKFYGTNPNGAWHLWILDDIGSDVGTLHAASMEFEASPSVDLGADTTICSWAVIDINAGGGNGSSYLWQDGSTDSIYIVNAMIMDSTQSHTFSVTVTNNSGCSNSDEIVINIDNCSGIDDINNEANNFSVFPNPAKENFSIEYINENSTNCKIKIRNIQGQLIETRQVNNLREGQRIFFNAEEWAEGIYNLNIETDASSSVLRMAIIK
jgi:subtilisin-like proprotein convertase family protein